MITLKFKKPIEIRINDFLWEGKEVQVKELKVAAEIIRIAREAYGTDILL